MNSFLSAHHSSQAVTDLVRLKSFADRTRAISRLWKCVVQSQDWLCNLEIGAQFLDSETAQHYLEIAQIPRLHRTYAISF